MKSIIIGMMASLLLIGCGGDGATGTGTGNGNTDANKFVADCAPGIALYDSTLSSAVDSTCATANCHGGTTLPSITAGSTNSNRSTFFEVDNITNGTFLFEAVHPGSGTLNSSGVNQEDVSNAITNWYAAEIACE